MAISAEKNETLKATSLAFGGNFFGKFISIPVGIVVASILGPEGFGLLAIINLIVQYMSYLNLGMLANITREVPIAFGKNDIEEVKAIYSTIFTNYTLTTAFGIVLLWIVYLFGIDYDGQFSTIHFIFISAIVLSSNSNSFFYTAVKGEGKFILYGQYELVSRILIPLIQVLLVYFFQLTGMLISLILQHLLSFIFLFYKLDFPSIRFKIDLAKSKELFSTGILMYINKIIDGIFISIGVFMAATFFSTADVGILSFALGFASINKVPFARILSVMVARKMAVEGGKHGIDDYARFSKYFEKPYAIYLFALSTILGVLVIFYSIVVNIFLQKFLPSIPILIILYFSLNFYNARYFLNSYIDITRQMSKRTLILVIGAVINVILCYVSVRMNMGIIGIGISVGFAMIVVSINTVDYVFRQVYNSFKMRFILLIKLFFISAVLTFIIYIFKDFYFIEYAKDYRQIWEMVLGVIDFGIKSMLFSLVSALLFIVLFKSFNVYDELKSLTGHVVGSIWSKLKTSRS